MSMRKGDLHVRSSSVARLATLRHIAPGFGNEPSELIPMQVDMRLNPRPTRPAVYKQTYVNPSCMHNI